MSLLKVNEIQIFNGENVTITAPTVVTANDNTNAALRITQTGTGNALVVEDDTNPDSTPFVVDASGSVGIGTSSPACKLDLSQGAVYLATINFSVDNIDSTFGSNLVKSSGAYTTPATNISGGAWEYRAVNNLNAHGEMLYLSAPDTNSLSSTPVERMRIDSSGNVGIGTNAPTEKLDVSGNINATGALTLGTALAVAEGGTGVTALSSLDAADLGSASATDGYVLTADGAGGAAWEAVSGGGGGTTAYLEHSDTISDSFTVTLGNNRMYIGGTTFSGTITVAGRLAIVAGPANFTGTINITGTLATV